MRDKPMIIQGDLAVDERGQVVFVNEFDFVGVKRFYLISNHQAGFVRAWHGHKQEAKYVLVVAGTALVGAVKIDNWDKPSPKAQVHRFVLSAAKPAVLYIPPGYANGSMTLTQDTQIAYYSTATLSESKQDDFRFPSRHWDIWGAVER